MKTPFRNGHMLAPIIGTGDPMKIIEDFKKQMLAKHATQKEGVIELNSKEEDLKIDPNKVQFTDELIRDIAEAHAAWLNKEMFFILPKDLYQAAFGQKIEKKVKRKWKTKVIPPTEEGKKRMKEWLHCKGITHGYDSDDIPFQYGIWRQGERIALNTVYLEKVKE